MRSLSICLAACTSLALAACGDDGSSNSSIDAGVDAPSVALDCSTYCDELSANCLDGAANRQYIDRASCIASCAFIPTGSLTDTQGNTLGCRIYHGGTPAQSNPALHCPHAGPGGDGACGMNCEGFCQIVMGACTGANQAYTDLNDCMTTCATFDTSVRYNTQVMTGNSLACRLYHATVASTNPVVHCPHVKAAPTGGGAFPCQ
ncbi:MAG TPA: hypothetical protein VHE35_33820 [Kofleriaceae bacterium]|nr:hypothetical protein [Kofleriaceae bacterium]